MSKTKAGGKTAQKTPRPGKRLGLKVAANRDVQPGNIIVRQRGTKFFPGPGVRLGKDHTLFALKKGRIAFTKKSGKQYISIVTA